MNKMLNKNSIFFKYNFRNNIHYRSKACGQYIYIYIYIYFFLKKLVFIQKGFFKWIETVIVKINIVRKHLFFE